MVGFCEGLWLRFRVSGFHISSNPKSCTRDTADASGLSCGHLRCASGPPGQNDLMEPRPAYFVTLVYLKHSILPGCHVGCPYVAEVSCTRVMSESWKATVWASGTGHGCSCQGYSRLLTWRSGGGSKYNGLITPISHMLTPPISVLNLPGTSSELRV